MAPFPRVDSPRSPARREQLAKEWLLRIVERTPAAEIGALPVARIIELGPALIGDILDLTADPLAAGSRELDPEQRRRVGELARLREGPAAAEQLPHDLAALQALLVEALHREMPDRRPGDLVRALERLAEVFGAVQAAVAGSLAEERAGGAEEDRLTGLPGQRQFEEELRSSFAEHRRYGHPFALGMIDLEGLGRINDAYGHEAGDRILTAVGAVVQRHVRGSDRTFRVGEDEFCVLAPHQRADGLRPAAERIAGLIASAQPENGPQIGIAVGIGCCPDDGETAEELREAAERALYEAKASGTQVSVSRNGATPLQDP